MILNSDTKRRLYQWAKQRLGAYSYRRGWTKSDCPACGKHKYGINLSQNRTNCFSCGYKPIPLELIVEVESLVNFTDAKNLLNTFDESLEYKEEKVEAFELKEHTDLPPGYRNIRRGNNRIAKMARKYVKSRGFEVDKVARFGWGYCTEGKYLNYLIMPYYYKGSLIYYNARLFFGDGPKFNNPLVEDFGLGKNMIIYNRDSLTLYKTIFAFESVMNCATLGDNTVGLGGKKISGYQKNVLIKSPCERIIIGLDDDAIEDSINLALALVDHKKIKILQFPEGKDVNDLGRKKTLMLAHRSRYLSYSDLIKMKSSI